MDYVFSKLDTSPNGVNIDFDIPKMNNSLEQVYIIFEAIQNYFSINKNTRGAIGVVTHQQTDDTPNSWVTLNNSNIIKFLELMTQYLSSQEVFGEGSDAQVVQTLNDAKKIIVIKYEYQPKVKKNGKVKVKLGGGFFSYYNKTHFDLSKYQIFKNANEANYTDNCLIYALRQAKCSESIINQFINKCKNREIPQCKLKELCESTNIQINLKTDKQTRDLIVYGNSTTQFNIGCLDNHYFINDEIAISTYCINNYHEIKGIAECNFIIKKQDKYYKRDNNYKTTAFKLIKAILDNKNTILEPITVNNGLLNTVFYSGNDKINSLEYNDNDCKKIENKQNIEKIDYPHKIFFDIETDPNNIHVPFLLCSEQQISNQWTKKNFVGYGDKCIKNFLDSLTENTLLIELPKLPGTLIVYRRPAERLKSSDHISLNSCNLWHMPLLEGEEKLISINLEKN
jgi:CRISPR/Cas system CMR-associated protein Cmr5 small subunit